MFTFWYMKKGLFHILMQKMVVSLSSDKAVWEAVMNNDVVREIRDLYNNGISQGE